jgi:hypothetical protein
MNGKGMPQSRILSQKVNASMRVSEQNPGKNLKVISLKLDRKTHSE